MNEESLTKVSPAEIVEIQKELEKSANDVMVVGTELEYNSAATLVKSVAYYRKMGLVPKVFDTDAKAAGAILFCKQLGLQPLVSWGEVAFINNKYAPFGSLFRAIAMRSPKFGEDDHFFLDESGKKICIENNNILAMVKPWAAVCRTKVKGGEVWKDYIFSKDMAKEAGLFKNAVWNNYMSDMLMHKAVTRSYRANYADALHGCTSYEDLVESWEPKEVNQQVSLNEV